MLAAHRDFEKFRGGSEREFLAWLRQILINCLHHAIETHVKAKRRDVRCEISVEQVCAALDRSAIELRAGAGRSGAVAQRSPAAARTGGGPGGPTGQAPAGIPRRDRAPQPAGLAVREIAERMNRKPGAVRMLWLRAIEKFKQTCDPID